MEEDERTTHAEELIKRGAACAASASGTPFEKFKALWMLYDLLNTTDHVDIMVSLACALNDAEPGLTAADKAELRKIGGLTFPEDWENMKDYR